MEDDLLAKLSNLSIRFEILKHPTVRTVSDGLEIMKNLQGCIPVNLLLKDEFNNFYLLLKNMNTKLTFTLLQKKLNITKLSSATTAEMIHTLNVAIGCVSVFALLNESARNVIVLIDDSISDTEKINFHPLINNSTLTVNYLDMIKFIELCGNKYQKIHLD